MTTALGVRCWPDKFAYVVLTGSVDKPVLVGSGHVRLPVNESRAAQLGEFRRDVYDILSQYVVSTACFRAQEVIARTKSILRAELEGVFQETCYSHKPRVAIVGRTVKQFKRVLRYSGTASTVFSLSVRSEFSTLGKINFSEALVAAMSALAQ